MKAATKLAKLIQQNPDLPVIPMVSFEVVCDDDHTYWMGDLTECELDAYTKYEDGVWFKSKSSELKDEMADGLKQLTWTPCIIVWIDTPEPLRW